jgi:hypothetical protein
MGYIRHDVLVIVTQARSDFDRQARALLRETREDDPRSTKLVKRTACNVNGYVIWTVLPDGSKEGWKDSDNTDAIRGRFEYLAQCEKWADGVRVRFGGDKPGKVTVETVSTIAED